MMTAIVFVTKPLSRAVHTVGGALGRMLERLAKAQPQLPPDEYPRFPIF
jgi:hypothetical protein